MRLGGLMRYVGTNASYIEFRPVIYNFDCFIIGLILISQ
jgi:hypothetical protein